MGERATYCRVGVIAGATYCRVGLIADATYCRVGLIADATYCRLGEGLEGGEGESASGELYAGAVGADRGALGMPLRSGLIEEVFGESAIASGDPPPGDPGAMETHDRADLTGTDSQDQAQIAVGGHRPLG